MDHCVPNSNSVGVLLGQARLSKVVKKRGCFFMTLFSFFQRESGTHSPTTLSHTFFGTSNVFHHYSVPPWCEWGHHKNDCSKLPWQCFMRDTNTETMEAMWTCCSVCVSSSQSKRRDNDTSCCRLLHCLWTFPPSNINTQTSLHILNCSITMWRGMKSGHCFAIAVWILNGKGK